MLLLAEQPYPDVHNPERSKIRDLPGADLPLTQDCTAHMSITVLLTDHIE